VVEAAALLNRSDFFATDRKSDITYRQARRDALDTFEGGYLTQLLLRTHGNVAQAARLASMDRVYLTRLLRRHKLRGGR
jgi:DNA-binding NtrC family response regulator